MKKTLTTLLCISVVAILLTAALSGCGGGSSDESGTVLTGDVNSLLEQVYANLGDAFELPALMSTPLSNDMEYGEQGIAYFIGTHDVPIVEGVASEAAIGAIPYSVVMVRVAPNTDVEAAKTLIKDNAPAGKWICVAADTVIVSSIGDVIILIMTGEEHSPGLGEAINQTFLALAP